MTLCEAHNWTPTQVDALDPDFVEELMTQKQARTDHELLSQKSKDAEVKRAQAKRRTELMKWRREHG